MALMRIYTVTMTTEGQFAGDKDKVETVEVVAETMKVLDDCFLFQTYVEEASCFRTDAAFDRVDGRVFAINSRPAEEG
ncbi:MAG: hypothetical protein ACRC90_02915 [Lactococcus garvieae]